MSESPLKVMLVEDQSLLRLGLKIVLERRGVTVVAEAENGKQAIEKLAESILADSPPDVILMDVAMPIMDGIEAAKQILAIDKEVKIIMLTSLDTESEIFASLAAGVTGYCLKETQPDQLLIALRSVSSGNLWIDSNIATKVLKRTISDHDAAERNSKQQSSQRDLSADELKCLHLIVEGCGTDEIAERLEISAPRMKEIEASIVEKLANRQLKGTRHPLAGNATADPYMEPAIICETCYRKFEDVYECCPFDGTALGQIDKLTGTTFADRYEIGVRLGAGGMSVVYKARHKLLNRFVAIKLLAPTTISDLMNAKRFREEALASSLLSHRNLINIIDFGLTAVGEPYLVMDYVKGKTLNGLLLERGFIDVQRALSIFIQVCDGLEHAHNRGVIHRDIKPGNIMLVTDETTGEEIVKIIDFGIAKVLDRVSDHALTRQGEILGSLSYMSPEQCRGEAVDARSDIYSLACAMYEALTGELVFVGENTYSTMQKHVHEEPRSMLELPMNDNIPLDLNLLVMRALSKDPLDRPQTMIELKTDLQQVQKQLKVAVS
jgi:DNA-binding NarL/FixJ family response regulator